MKTTLKDAQHYKWGNNCDAHVLLKDKNLSVKFERMPSGTFEEKHFHNYSQQYFFILKGEAVFEIEEEKITAKEKEGIQIPPNTKHKIMNECQTEIEFLVISQPSVDNDRENS